MKLAFIILAHDDAENLFRLIKRLLSKDDLVVVHWDKKNPYDILAAAHEKFEAKTRSRLRFARPVAVEWGRWSMVEATLSCLEELEQSVEVFDYVVLLSGVDYPVKPISALKAFLAQQGDKEYIECVDPEHSAWVVDGLVQERYQQYHWINWRDHPKLFSFIVSLQKKLGIKRKLPGQLKAHLGSQWWALTWPTLQKILQMGRRRKIRAFFSRTWVPDELFFPTLVAALVPRKRIVSSGLTFYHFSHQGRPLVFYNDHFDFLVKQEAFFARKLSPQATDLRDRLDYFIDNVALALQPINALSKQLADYEHFIAVQWRGLPGRRIIGRQVDAWYGDLEWNKLPYFVILCYPGARLEPLREALNAMPNICCYGEIFRGGHIDYGLPGREHPLYPENKPALRDMKRPNFLGDLLHANHGRLVGFILRLPCGNEMEKMVIYDPQATLIFVFPDDRYLAANAINWQCAFESMIMHDNLAEARRVGKQSVMLVALDDDSLSLASIAQATAHIGCLPAGIAC
ncbi:MAG: beta-1,6-N-acetylglucosaminyltransferase [Methylovulum sp.]|uniref:beta-1,6-N-acetylglucosaminyltransferase n=1 Tax=Methylovulum sp. TaxID=1916980 RepID=UPI002625D049|nr:beta-1,6-N-acetylglucosaminyltransferase [Methylovulum sp.]MDD2724969.1 beta-1,6-N-acetylglucosaminyltransferase [Methylovulum sp.]MDD5123507.1 beta-1,6-N-acetylglucosaminyltransferase [Methylovulum sp.]